MGWEGGLGTLEHSLAEVLFCSSHTLPGLTRHCSPLYTCSAVWP